VRFLVVDEHLRILDKDPNAGYVLFGFAGQEKFRGSLEVMTCRSTVERTCGS